jgi:tripartite-type tricarboxylate transporter receptor subunit TctC
MVHVPYRGTTPALQDIMGNTVDVFFDNLGSSLSLHLGGQLRILGVCGPERSASLPDVPAIRESGIPDFTSVTWFAVMAPKGTPDAIIQKLNTTVTDILKDDDVKAKFGKLGVQVETMDLNATAKLIAAERVRWGEIIRSAHVTID